MTDPATQWQSPRLTVCILHQRSAEWWNPLICSKWPQAQGRSCFELKRHHMNRNECRCKARHFAHPGGACKLTRSPATLVDEGKVVQKEISGSRNLWRGSGDRAFCSSTLQMRLAIPAYMQRIIEACVATYIYCIASS